MKRRFTAFVLLLMMIFSALPVRADNNQWPPLFDKDGDVCYTMADVHARLEKQTYLLEKEFDINYSSDLEWLFEDDDLIYDLLYSYGMMDWHWTRWKKSHRLKVHGIEYYNGFKVFKALCRGRLDLLTDREKQMLDAARSVADGAMNTNTLIEREMYIHDYLCRNVVYTEDDNMKEDDSAIGALLNGQANCDGYSDAFYLIASLVGFDVDFICGQGTTGAHLWNLIELDGLWYFLDVTWDDPDFDKDNGFIRYSSFNVSKECMNERTWNDVLLKKPVQRYMNWDLYPYTCGEGTPGNVGVYTVEIDDAALFMLQWHREGRRRCHIMVKGDYQWSDLSDKMSSLFNKKGEPGYWWTWSRKVGEYTAFDVCFTK